jgi:hypothetical protein
LDNPLEVLHSSAYGIFIDIKGIKDILLGVTINHPSGYSYLSQKEKSLPGIFVDDNGKYTGIQGGGEFTRFPCKML